MGILFQKGCYLCYAYHHVMYPRDVWFSIDVSDVIERVCIDRFNNHDDGSTTLLRYPPEPREHSHSFRTRSRGVQVSCDVIVNDAIVMMQ